LFAAGIVLMSVHGATRAGVFDPPPRDDAYYGITDLGYFQARELDERPALNRANQIAAWQVVDSTREIAVLLAGSAPIVIPDLPDSSNSFALGINARGQAVGMLESASDLRDTQAFFNRNGKSQILPSLGGHASAARCINSSGLIAGNAQTETLQVHAAAWLGGEVRDLGTLPGGDYSRAFDVNQRGEIAGESNSSANGKARAVIWSRDGIHALGLLPGGSFSSAQAINARDVVVGYADHAGGQPNAVRFQHGRVQNLGTLGDEPSSALGINDDGEIVGASAIAEGMMRAFVWRNGRMYDLNRLIRRSGWLLLSAYRINEAGNILAYGFYQGRTHLCLLTPHRPDRAKQ
jgi:probable HAF family extracellular repeat protein